MRCSLPSSSTKVTNRGWYSGAPGTPDTPALLHFPAFTRAPTCMHSTQAGMPVLSPAASCATVYHASGRPRRTLHARLGLMLRYLSPRQPTEPALPPCRIPLSVRGVAQAEAAGVKVRQLLQQHCGPDFRLFMYTSPYARCIQTAHHMLHAFEDHQVRGALSALAACSAGNVLLAFWCLTLGGG
jgi:hypothetical protein